VDDDAKANQDSEDDNWDAILEQLMQADTDEDDDDIASSSQELEDELEAQPAVVADESDVAHVSEFIVIGGSLGPPATPFYIVDSSSKQFLGRPPAADVCRGPYARCWVDQSDKKEVQQAKQPRDTSPLIAEYDPADVICSVELGADGILTSASVCRIVKAFEIEAPELDALIPAWARTLAASASPAPPDSLVSLEPVPPDPVAAVVNVRAPAKAPARVRAVLGKRKPPRPRPGADPERAQAFYTAKTASVSSENVLRHKRRRT
jgi:hypothetical protein